MMTELLSIQGVSLDFNTGRRSTATTIHALRDVSLAVGRGEVVGLVGESGSGKSTLARVACGLQSYDSGSVSFEGRPLREKRTKSDRRKIQMVFQDPYASLDPRMTVRQTLVEVIRVHSLAAGAGVRKRSAELMELVQMPVSLLDSRPGGMSGGQRQRVAIARALAAEPTLLVADEAVAALDVSVQAGVVNLFADLRETLDLSILFIAHDLAVVRSLCERIDVIYRGKIVESKPCVELFENPEDPYTQRLLSAIPRLDGARTEGLASGTMHSAPGVRRHQGRHSDEGF